MQGAGNAREPHAPPAARRPPVLCVSPTVCCCRRSAPKPGTSSRSRLSRSPSIMDAQARLVGGRPHARARVRGWRHARRVPCPVRCVACRPLLARVPSGVATQPATPIPGHKLSQSVWVCVAIITARQGAVLGSKAQGAAKSMGLDSAFQAVDKLSATDAERRQEEEEAAHREAGHKLKDILRMPEALKVWRAGGYRR